MTDNADIEVTIVDEFDVLTARIEPDKVLLRGMRPTYRPGDTQFDDDERRIDSRIVVDDPPGYLETFAASAMRQAVYWRHEAVTAGCATDTPRYGVSPDAHTLQDNAKVFTATTAHMTPEELADYCK